MKIRHGIRISRGVGKAKAPWGKGSAGLFSRSCTPPPLMESVPQVGKLHPMTPRSVIVASAGSGPQLPHTDVATNPEVLPPDNKDISGCHLSSFLCLSEEYQIAVQAGTALGDAGELQWDTIQLQRVDMLLMVATSRHHGMPTLPNSKDVLQGALFNLWTPDAKHRHHQPNTTHLDPLPPEALAVARDLSSWDCPSVDQVLWGGDWGGWEGGVGGGGCSPGPIYRRPRGGPGRPPPRALATPPSSLAPPRAPISPPWRSPSKVSSFSWGTCTGSRCVRGRSVKRLCGVGCTSPRRALPPGAADQAVAPPQHCPSVAAAKAFEGWGKVDRMSM